MGVFRLKMPTNSTICPDGLLIGAMETSWISILIYLVALLYCFLGIAIVADVFMVSIEQITSKKKRIRIVVQDAGDDDGIGDDNEAVVYKEVPVWNATVANLTLMALGSSAPEILLSFIEIIGNGFYIGELGPSTIVGSAAFNLLSITAICVLSVSSPDVRRVDKFVVFVITSIFSVFAYIWLLLILLVFSPNVVQIWEGVMTLALMVLLVLAAYLADIGVICDKIGAIVCKRTLEPVEMEERGVEEKVALKNGKVDWIKEKETLRKFDSSHLPSREHLHELIREVAQMYPNLSIDDQAKMVAWRLKEAEQRDRIYYRIMTSRAMSKWMKKEQFWNAASRSSTVPPDSASPQVALRKRTIEFSARIYAIRNGDQQVRLKVHRHRGESSTKPLLFRYSTVDGVAENGTHFVHKSDTVEFRPGQTDMHLDVDLVSGVAWTSKDVFYVALELADADEDRTVLGRCKVAEVVHLVEQQQPGNTVEFVKNHATVMENAGFVRLAVVRRGNVGKSIPKVVYETRDGTAEQGKDYVGGHWQLTFDENEVEKYVDIGIIDDMEEEADETFTVMLKNCPSEDVQLGCIRQAVVTILCDDGTNRYFRQMNRLLPDMLDQLTPGKESWTEQLISASSVNAGDVQGATLYDCFIHVICFPWKILFALVPPSFICDGWLTFLIALTLIGIITAVVGDLANLFGCMLGLRASVTAITFVALGTSLPDTFASRRAALQDRTADNAIGNVTGSNSVNVFLGLGLPWSLAAIYWASKGQVFHVSAGTLGFSVAIYTVVSVFCLCLLFARRKLSIFGKGELGGPQISKIVSALFMIVLWLVYVLFSALQAYGLLPF